MSKVAKRHRYTIPTMAAQVVLWWSNWKRQGSGNDPEIYEKGWRKITRDPNPETPLDFSEK